MSKLTVVILLFSVVGCSHLKPHPRPWTQTEKLVAVYFITAHTLDAYTTERHQDYPDRFYERNRVLGRHPKDEEIAIYFCISGLAAIIVSHYYPELRLPLLGSYGSINLYYAHQNYHLLKER